MSFLKSLKGLADDFKDLISDKDDQKKKDEKLPAQSEGGERGHLTSVSQDQNAHQYYNGQQIYAQPSHSMQQQYQQHPPASQGYSSAPPGPTLPYGWIQQWDSNSQRYYYLEQATGRTQWDLPMDHDRGIGNVSLNQNYHGGYQTGYGHGYDTSANAHYPGAGSAPYEVSKNGKVKKDGNKGGMLAAGVGGLALGGLAGAALAGDSSDDEHHTSGNPAGHGGLPGAGYGAPVAGPASYGAQPGYGMPAPAADDPQALEHNSDVSSSQRSSLEEARHDYEKAQREAADSDASSSDQEEAEEARKEYEEEIEEARSDAED